MSRAAQSSNASSSGNQPKQRWLIEYELGQFGDVEHLSTDFMTQGGRENNTDRASVDGFVSALGASEFMSETARKGKSEAGVYTSAVSRQANDYPSLKVDSAWAVEEKGVDMLMRVWVSADASAT